jgi:hypothetical protein
MAAALADWKLWVPASAGMTSFFFYSPITGLPDARFAYGVQEHFLTNRGTALWFHDSTHAETCAGDQACCTREPLITQRFARMQTGTRSDPLAR